MSWAVISVLLGLIFVGVPIGFALMMTATGMMYAADINLMMIPVQMFSGTNAFPLLAIPLFILMGELMSATSISERLIDLASALVGWIRGGLSQVNVVTNMFMAEMSGSGVADAAALSKIFVPEMERAGYPKAFAGAITSSAATLGIIIPPSIPMVLYGITTNTSIRDLFLGGIIPGILLGGGFMIANYVFARRGNHPVDRAFELPRLGVALKRAVVPLLIPVIVLGGIIGGIFTATEGAAIAVVYALVIGFFVTRVLKISDLPGVLFRAAVTAAMVGALIAFAATVTFVFTIDLVPLKLSQAIQAFTSDPTVFILLVMVMLIVVGMFIESNAAYIMLVPLFAPIALAYHIDPLFFGFLFVLNLVAGMMTPPVGVLLFVMCGITRISMTQLVRSVWPFVVLQYVVLILCLIFPDLVTALPRYLGF